MKHLNIIFLGTPEFAVPTLEALIAHTDISVLAVVTQPDRPSGRKHEVHETPCKRVALSHNIPVLQPESLAKSAETVEALTKMAPDLIVMVAFGQILKKAILNLPTLGVINLHASLLPAYRGAAPINWAIINGDTTTGITTMFTESGIDTGPTLLKSEISLSADIDAQSLSKELSIKGAQLTIETLEQLMSGSLVAEKQDDKLATYAPILTKELGLIDWSKSAQDIHNLIRGLVPWPGTHTFFQGVPIKIWKTTLVPNIDHDLEENRHTLGEGAVFSVNKNVYIKCGSGGSDLLRLVTVQPFGRNKLPAYDWLNGLRLLTGGVRLGK